MNFVALYDAPGRSYDGKILTFWWRDHQHPNLFTDLSEQDRRLSVVIDMNVLIDFSQDSMDAEESKCLLADWLSEIEICTTGELLNEIERIDDNEKREAIRKKATSYRQIIAPYQDIIRLQEELIPLFPEQLSVNDESDMRHLATAIAANITFFVTRDDNLLRMADHIYERYQMRIVRPAQLVIYFDELLRENVYQPIRLAGTQINRQLVKQDNLDIIVQTFHNSGQNETPAQFRTLIRRYLADPRMFESVVICNQDNLFLALLVIRRLSPEICEIPLFRVVRNPLMVTLARYLAFSTISRVANNNSFHYVYITDHALPQPIQQILAEEGFHTGTHGWLKLTLRAGITISKLQDVLFSALPLVPIDYSVVHSLPTVLGQLDNTHDSFALLELERLLWPVKILDADIPTFIMPIKPVWAQHLFDESLAHQNLFGVDTELALRRECVFYRVKQPNGGLQAPARVLWYVSKDKNYAGSGAIRACSYVDEITIGRPKPLFTRFRRLGAYEWKQLFETAHRNIEKEIMVVRFRDTELLPFPIRWGDTLKTIVPNHANFQSPVRITSEMFATLYQQGIGQEG